MLSWEDIIISILSVLFIVMGLVLRSLRKNAEAHSKKNVHSLLTLRHVFSGSRRKTKKDIPRQS